MTESKRRVRVAILWSTLSGYFNACVEALAATGRAEVLLLHQRAVASAPFEATDLAGVTTIARDGEPVTKPVLDAIDGFDPDVLLITSWHYSAFRAAAKHRQGKSLRVLCMDN